MTVNKTIAYVNSMLITSKKKLNLLYFQVQERGQEPNWKRVCVGLVGEIDA